MVANQGEVRNPSLEESGLLRIFRQGSLLQEGDKVFPLISRAILIFPTYLVDLRYKLRLYN